MPGSDEPPSYSAGRVDTRMATCSAPMRAMTSTEVEPTASETPSACARRSTSFSPSPWVETTRRSQSAVSS